MYWYVYFNLFQDLILRLWPRNQYLHLWSTTFNQFCARLCFAMDCFWLDTCKQSSIALSYRLLAAFCVAVQWEVTGHSNPRLAAGHHPTAFPGSLHSCPPFLHVLLRLSPPCLCSWLATIWLWFMINKVHSNDRVREAYAEQMQMALSAVMIFFSIHAAPSVSPFLAYLSAEMDYLIPTKYRCCLHV